MLCDFVIVAYGDSYNGRMDYYLTFLNFYADEPQVVREKSNLFDNFNLMKPRVLLLILLTEISYFIQSSPPTRSERLDVILTNRVIYGSHQHNRIY